MKLGEKLHKFGKKFMNLKSVQDLEFVFWKKFAKMKRFMNLKKKSSQILLKKFVIWKFYQFWGKVHEFEKKHKKRKMFLKKVHENCEKFTKLIKQEVEKERKTKKTKHKIKWKMKHNEKPLKKKPYTCRPI